MYINRRKIVRIASTVAAFLLGGLPVAADPITGFTGWLHGSMVTAGSDLTTVIIIVCALAGMMKGWMGVIAGALLGMLIAVLVANADIIRLWAHSISLI